MMAGSSGDMMVDPLLTKMAMVAVEIAKGGGTKGAKVLRA